MTITLSNKALQRPDAPLCGRTVRWNLLALAGLTAGLALWALGFAARLALFIVAPVPSP